MKLTKILESLIKELNVPTKESAYKFDSITKKPLSGGQQGNYYTYLYTNVKGDKMEITNLVDYSEEKPGKVIYIAFGKEVPSKDEEEIDDEDRYYDEEEEEEKYKEKTGAGDFIKVLATVVEAVKQTMKKEGGDKAISAIFFSPSDKKRERIYDYYIKSLFPDFERTGKKSIFTRYANKKFSNKAK